MQDLAGEVEHQTKSADIRVWLAHPCHAPGRASRSSFYAGFRQHNGAPWRQRSWLWCESRVSSDFGITGIADNNTAAEESLAMESLCNDVHVSSEFSEEASVTMLPPDLLDLAILDLDLSAL